MPQTITAKPNQSMQDLVLMACGTLDGAMAFCRANGLAISDVPVVGEDYIIPDDIARNKAVLRELGQSGTVIGTLNLETPPLPAITGSRVLLDPRLVASAGDYPSVGWQFTLADTLGQFVNYYSLVHTFELAGTPVRFEGKTDFAAGLPFVGILAEVEPPFHKHLRWPYSTMMGGGFYMIWSDLGATYVTTKWVDDHGNFAIYSPLIVLKATYEINQLIPTIDVVPITISPTEIMFHITWVHPSITFPQFNVTGFDWLGAALGGTPVLGVPNCVRVSLPIGIYTIGAVTHYANDDASTIWPDSYKTLVIEVY